jgi:hypothetical protein
MVGNRRLSNGEQTYRITALAMAKKPSVDFSGIGSGIWLRRGSAIGGAGDRRSSSEELSRRGFSSTLSNKEI